MCKQTDKVAQYISTQIQMGRFKKIGIWLSELCSHLLWKILTAMPPKTRISLDSLLFYSLYDYCGLSNSHDQSTCYQLHSQLYKRTGQKPNVICPIHKMQNTQKIMYHRTSLDIAILAAEYPRYPLMTCEAPEYRINEYTSKIDCCVRDYRSRYFERYAKTPKSIRIASPKMVGTASEILVLVKTREDYSSSVPKTTQINIQNAKSIRLSYNARLIEV